jgi:putative membrane protein
MQALKNCKFFQEIRNFFNGVIFGWVQIVPGVSAGTIAIILGFYDQLLDSINNFRKNYKKSLRFLIPLGLGAGIGIVLFSSITDFLITNYSFPTMLFFIGLIVGIIPPIFSIVKEPGQKLKLKEILLIVIPIIVLVAVSHLTTAEVTDPAQVVAGIGLPYMLFILLVGVIAAASLIIPGLSGSFVLLLFGIYPLAIYAVSQIRVLIGDPTNTEVMLEIVKVLVPLGIGIVIGGIAAAKLVAKLLKTYRKPVYAVILGLLIGSVYSIFMEPIVFQSGTSTPFIIVGVVAFVAGAVLSFKLGQKKW